MKKITLDNQTLGKAIIETLNEGKKVSFTVKGISMKPFFKDDQTVVTLMKKIKYQKNDVIFFKYQQSFKLHRIRKIKKGNIICSGDFLRQKEMIEDKDILGYVLSYQEGNRKEVLTTSFRYRFKVWMWLRIKPLLLWVIR